MRFEVISYSNKAGRNVNCDRMVCMEKADKVSAVLCTAAGDAEEAIKKIKQCSLDAMEQLCLLENTEMLGDVWQASGNEAVQGAALLMIRGKKAAWYCEGAARVYLFSDGEQMEYSTEGSPCEEKTELKPGDAVIVCSQGFYNHVSSMEMEIDLCRSADAGEWLDNLLIRYLNSSGLSGESMSVLCCTVKEK
ncbi:MAG: hypothetical protein E7487_06460 [Ruminococcaceae bacterium]|nr:hypothetical protein [Oscillospiraceae bacterium]